MDVLLTIDRHSKPPDEGTVTIPASLEVQEVARRRGGCYTPASAVANAGWWE